MLLIKNCASLCGSTDELDCSGLHFEKKLGKRVSRSSLDSSSIGRYNLPEQ